MTLIKTFDVITQVISTPINDMVDKFWDPGGLTIIKKTKLSLFGVSWGSRKNLKSIFNPLGSMSVFINKKIFDLSNLGMSVESFNDFARIFPPVNFSGLDFLLGLFYNSEMWVYLNFVNLHIICYCIFFFGICYLKNFFFIFILYNFFLFNFLHCFLV